MDPVPLRRQAEAQLRAQLHRPSPPTSEETLRLVHDLQVHQIELELQNNALLEIRDRLEQGLEKYTDLYDFSPVGYFTLTRNGTIQDVNLTGATLLTMDRAPLVGRRLSVFIAEQSRPGFNAFLERMLSGVTREHCEVVITHEGALPRYFHLQGVGLEGETGWQCRISALDITDRKRIETALRRSEEQYRAVIETSPDGFWIVDRQGRLLEVNEAYARLSGYSRTELQAMTIADLEVNESPAEIVARTEKIIRDGSDLFQTLHRAKSGRVWQAELNIAYWPIADGRFFSFIRDVNRRQRSEALLKVRLHLSEAAARDSLDELLRVALDIAERFTGSTISFFHFVDPDQEHVILQTWSNNTLKTMCTAVGKGQHYPISQAGVWADCIRQRQPVIHNDYASLPDKKGLPEGHASLIRELVVPILRNGEQSVALLGVGNKPEDYDEDDLEVVQQLAAMAMEVVERKWAEERIAHLAYHDPLTELPNRALLTDRLQQAMAKTVRDQRRLAICYLDLDGFKPINDAWGHAQGDQALISVAQRLKQCVRAGDTVARIGGDEFALLFNDLVDLDECEQALDRVIATLRILLPVAGQSPALLTASMGVTLYPDDHSDPDALLRHADQAMYAAKQAGGNRYQLFNPDFDCRTRSDREIRQQVQDGQAADDGCR
jgi:diguanylate cyclase (GGDEF)-like protein/PAS domain S-box-containing protein